MRPTAGSRLLPSGAIVLAAMLYGVWWLPLRALADTGLDGYRVNALLYGVVLIGTLPWVWARRKTIRDGGLLLVGSGGCFGVAMVLWNLALIWGEVVRVTLLFYLAPVWATLLAITLLGGSVRSLRLLTIVLGLTGAGFVLGLADGPPLPRGPGEWVGLLSGILFALSATLVRLGSRIDGRDQTLVSFLVAGPVALAALLLAPPVTMSALPSFGALLGPGLLASLWLLPVTWLVLWGARYLEPGRVSLILLIEVLVAALSASLLTDETLTWREIGGCALILAAGLLEAIDELRAGRKAVRSVPPGPTSVDSREGP